MIAGIPGLLADTGCVRQSIADKWRKKPAVLEMNLKAFDEGLPLGADIKLGSPEVMG